MTDASLTSLDNIKNFLDVLDGVDTFDEAVWSFALMATSMVQRECRRDFCHQEQTQIFDTRTNYQNTLALGNVGALTQAGRTDVRPTTYKLRGYPITADTAIDVWYSPSRVYDDETKLGEGDYVLEPEKQGLVLLVPTRVASRALKVSYTAGYPLAYGPANAEYEQNVFTSTTVDTDMTGDGGVAALFDTVTDRPAGQSATLAANTGTATLVFKEPQVVTAMRWYAPNDAGVHPGATQTTLTLTASLNEDMSDPVELVSEIIKGVGAGAVLELDNNSATPYKAYKLEATLAGATGTQCAQVEFDLADLSRPHMGGVPSDLCNATALLAKHLFQKNRTSGFGMEAGGDRNTSQFNSKSAFPPDILEMILPYRQLLRGRR